MAVRLTRGQAKALGLATRKGKVRARPPRKLPAGWCVTLTLPCVVRSEMNARGHWAVRHKRFDAQRLTLTGVLFESGLHDWHPPFPVVVTFTHVGRRMDSDNLASAFKHLRDTLAAWMLLDDADPRVTWEYEQVAASPGGVRVAVRGR